MDQRSRTSVRTASTTPHDDEALHRTVSTPTVTPRRLIAAGIKRGSGRLVVQEVAA